MVRTFRNDGYWNFRNHLENILEIIIMFVSIGLRSLNW